MSAGSVADKYISRAGGSPQPTRDDLVNDLVTVSNFILWHDENHIQGGVRTREAWMSFCRLMNVEPFKIEQVIRPKA